MSINVLGGVGNDTITNSGFNSTLDGGDGDDLIHNGYYYYELWNTYYFTQVAIMFLSKSTAEITLLKAPSQ